MAVAAKIVERQEGIMRTIIALAILAVVAAGFLGLTTPGHHLLNMLGFATADCGGSQC